MAKTVINYDKEATPSDVAKINRWAQNTLNGATSLIPEPEFLALLDSEMKKINNTPGYLGAQVKSCTTALGGW